MLTCRQSRIVYWQKVWSKIDLEDVVGRVQSEIRNFKKLDQIAVDVIGVGAGVVDMLSRLYTKGGVSINSANRVEDGVNYILRAKMMDELKVWLEDAPVSLPNDPELRSDLTALKYYFRGGLRLMESKEDSKKSGIISPDRADSFCLTFA